MIAFKINNAHTSYSMFDEHTKIMLINKVARRYNLSEQNGGGQTDKNMNGLLIFHIFEILPIKGKLFVSTFFTNKANTRRL